MKTSNMKNTFLWTLQIVTALAILLLGAAKIGSFPYMVDVFAKIGFGQWFRYAIGAIELFGALALLTEAYAAVAAFFFAYLMLGALIAQIWVVGGSPHLQMALFVATMAIAIGRVRKSRYFSGNSLTY